MNEKKNWIITYKVLKLARDCGVAKKRNFRSACTRKKRRVRVIGCTEAKVIAGMSDVKNCPFCSINDSLKISITDQVLYKLTNGKNRVWNAKQSQSSIWNQTSCLYILKVLYQSYVQWKSCCKLVFRRGLDISRKIKVTHCSRFINEQSGNFIAFEILRASEKNVILLLSYFSISHSHNW